MDRASDRKSSRVESGITGQTRTAGQLAGQEDLPLWQTEALKAGKLTPVARATDPDTSHDATPTNASRQTQMGRLLKVTTAGPCTTEQAARGAGIEPWQEASKRVADLKNVGLVRDSGRRVIGSRGRRVIVWEAVAAVAVNPAPGQGAAS